MASRRAIAVALIALSGAVGWTGAATSAQAAVRAAPIPRSSAGATGVCAASSSIQVHPGDPVHRIARHASIGTVICFSRGTYRLRTPIEPDGQTFVGHHAVLTGARPLHFTEHAGHWTAPEFHANGQRNGQCLPETTTICTFPNDVLRDGVPMHRVLHAPTKPGQYAIDYAANRVVMAGSPAGHRFAVEVSPAAFQAISGDTGRGVTVRGFTIKNFASPAQHGAIDTTQTGWTISNNRIAENHGAGISTGGQAHVRHNIVTRNGEEGIAGTGRGTVVTGNLVTFNNFQRRFDPGWEAGGCKWAVASRLRVRFNTVRYNYGPGLWDDIDSYDVTYDSNVVEFNAFAGIFHEIGGSATIEHNHIDNNGAGKPQWLWGSGILIAASHDVDIAHNYLRLNAEGIGEVQQDRGISSRDGSPRVLSNVAVRDNKVHLSGGTTGLVEDNGDTALFSDPTLTWAGNEYWGTHGRPFEWNDTELTSAQWKRVGHDVHGTFQP